MVDLQRVQSNSGFDVQLFLFTGNSRIPENLHAIPDHFEYLKMFYVNHRAMKFLN